MKPTTLLLAASLFTNIGLVALVATRPAAPAPNAASTPHGAHDANASGKSEALRAALASGDAAALEAAGVSAEIARELALGRALSRFAARAGAAGRSEDARWWRNQPARGAREQELAGRRELSDALIAALGYDPLGLDGQKETQLAFLSPTKRQALRRITQDYDEMIAKFSAGGVQLASDREKLRLLRAERERDIAALLTPEERAAYEMRTSTTSTMVRSRYGDAIESEAEFQKIYALQKAFDEKFPREALTGRITPEVLKARADAERQLEGELRAAVGDERYAALRRAADPDLRTLDALASRLNLPPTATGTLASARDAFAAESQRINSDTSVPVPQRRAQIQALAAEARAEITRTLGAEAAEAYAQRSPWLSMLQSGMAYSTTPQEGAPGSLMPGGQSVFPVMPAGVVPAGAQRQMVISASPAFEVAGGELARGGDVQVMTFAATGTVEAGAAPAPANARAQAGTAPAQPPSAPLPPKP
jgi:hypothetical protein